MCHSSEKITTFADENKLLNKSEPISITINIMTEINEILFSRTMKAGRRMYYIDVKQDKNDEYYLSVTESKRVKDGTEFEKPVFEKHKIFLYREDLLKFNDAFQEAMDFIRQNAGLTERAAWKNQEEQSETAEEPAEEPAEPAEVSEPEATEETPEEDEFKIDIEF